MGKLGYCSGGSLTAPWAVCIAPAAVQSPFSAMGTAGSHVNWWHTMCLHLYTNFWSQLGQLCRALMSSSWWLLMTLQSSKQFFLTHSATSNISINPELILFPSITSSVTISDERREIKWKTVPTIYLVEKIPEWSLSWWLPGHDKPRGNLLSSKSTHHLCNMALICSQETLSGFCQRACDC